MRHRSSLSGVESPFQSRIVQTPSGAELSLVIPVYNGSRTIAALVDEICRSLADIDFEIVLVNDGSIDDSEHVCTALAQRYPDHLIFLQLTRNFGEHNAVMAGMKHASGNYLAILDDDGQNAIEDVRRLYQHAKKGNFDVVYSRYSRREHPRLRILGSWFNDRAANILLKKPRGLYLSSFKVMNRTVVDEVIRYSGPFPYVDGLILRVSRKIGQLDATHLPRRSGQSGYTLSKLVALWLNMSVGFSLVPLRLSVLAGIFAIIASILIPAAALCKRIMLDPQASIGISCLVGAVICAAGVQLISLGIIGEYVGRIFLHQNGTPQNVVRYIRHGQTQSDSKSHSRDSAGAVMG